MLYNIAAVKIWLKIALSAVRLPKFEPVNGEIMACIRLSGWPVA